MKKIVAIIIIPYMIIVAVAFYIYFGPGLFSSYEPLDWRGLMTNIPEGFKVSIYQSQDKKWEFYSLRKIFVGIKIALGPAMDVNRLPGDGRKMIYRTSPNPERTFYISSRRKSYEVVFAQTIGDTTVYFSVASGSVFSAVHILDKITANNFYQGEPITLLKPSIPFRAYITDLIFFFGMLLPVFIIVLIFSLSGKKPASKYFIGDPIRCEENFVYFTSVQKYRRKSSACYLVLTATRLMVFVFRKLIWEIKLNEARASIRIEGKKIILQKDNDKAILRPGDIKKWNECLAPYLY
ncbi:MAG: hypothetical protein GTO45_23575 [Candidatus Aminicenantes bacterium]|nr:hypothetical protein [Candidatus Aminicenantes bacterium]NIM81739.1 hypothetical protein [Candidatus Aminicenantes bacterium]NIN21110.1 hypothetical protein [Candidatus Aminicenantes bacterium]NIN44932.1 hypothetical protein [Candidatus Aminicenantes bacterium]NIN87746.1 hypothetical protein [Candidatus Aminicenantes bacterium]